MKAIYSVPTRVEVAIDVPAKYEFYFKKDEDEWTEEEWRIGGGIEFYDWLYSECEKQVGELYRDDVELEKTVD